MTGSLDKNISMLQVIAAISHLLINVPTCEELWEHARFQLQPKSERQESSIGTSSSTVEDSKTCKTSFQALKDFLENLNFEDLRVCNPVFAETCDKLRVALSKGKAT